MSESEVTAAFYTLLEGETQIAAGPELLFRQVTDHQWDAQRDQPSSRAFAPAPIDHGKPSFSRGSLTTPQASRDWHQEHARSRSRGVWACSVAETEGVGLRAVDDSKTPFAEGEVRAPGHAYVDFRHVEKPEERRVRSLLLARAIARGKVPTTDSATPEPT